MSVGKRQKNEKYVIPYRLESKDCVASTQTYNTPFWPNLIDAHKYTVNDSYMHILTIIKYAHMSTCLQADTSTKAVSQSLLRDIFVCSIPT